MSGARGGGMSHQIDLHLGRRLRRRRRLLGYTQHQLASAVGIRFQQVQKYECGANRMSAARLWELARVLDVPIHYFYDGLPASPAIAETAGALGELMGRKETLDLIQAYHRLDDRPRRKLLDLAKSLRSGAAEAG